MFVVGGRWTLPGNLYSLFPRSLCEGTGSRVWKSLGAALYHACSSALFLMESHLFVSQSAWL